MRNNLKFSLLSTLICTMVIGNSGYSMQRKHYNYNNYNNYNNNINKIPNEILQQFEKAKNNINNYSSIYPHAGLANIGATCYMDACLQCLANDTDFVKSFLKEVALKYNKLNLANNETKLVLELAKIMAQLWILPFKNDYFDEKAYYDKAKDFQKILVKCNPLFKMGQPGDSKDLLIYLFETIHEVLYPNNKIFDGENMNKALQYFQNNKSCVYNSFYFMNQSNMICKSCGNVNNSYQITNFLEFPLEKVKNIKYSKQQQNYNNFIFDNNTVTIDDCFAYDSAIESLTGDNRISCNKCRQMSNATTQNQIVYTPNTLAIVLNRGKNNVYNVKMPIPENIDLQNCVKYRYKNGEIYYLSSVICHMKDSNGNSYGNHFITLAKTKPDSPWARYNDAIVDTLEDSNGKEYIKKVLSGNSNVTPYILFYKKMTEEQIQDSKLSSKNIYKVQPNMSEINQPQNKFNNANGFYNMYGMYNQNYYMNNMMMGMNYNNNK